METKKLKYLLGYVLVTIFQASCSHDITSLRNTCDVMVLMPDTIWNKVKGGAPSFIIVEKPICPEKRQEKD